MINLTIELITSELYKIPLMLLKVLTLYPVLWNNSVVIGHSSSMCLTDRIFLQTRHMLPPWMCSWTCSWTQVFCAFFCLRLFSGFWITLMDAYTQGNKSLDCLIACTHKCRQIIVLVLNHTWIVSIQSCTRGAIQYSQVFNWPVDDDSNVMMWQ